MQPVHVIQNPTMAQVVPVVPPGQGQVQQVIGGPVGGMAGVRGGANDNMVYQPPTPPTTFNAPPIVPVDGTMDGSGSGSGSLPRLRASKPKPPKPPKRPKEILVTEDSTPAVQVNGQATNAGGVIGGEFSLFQSKQ